MNNKIIPFYKPYFVGDELNCISQAMATGHVSGGGLFTKRAVELLNRQLDSSSKIMLTTSCTHALEMVAILLDLKPDDEVIIPAFTFVTTALAFVMHGAKPIFSDVRPDTLNIDESKLEGLITDKTRAVVLVHYAGVACNMDSILAIAKKYNLVVIEDNAHGLYGKYKGKFLGTFGHFATLSFHETKNITCGEGGALIINDSQYIRRAEIISEKGTDRASFFRGEKDKYTWVDKGSSYVMADILAAFLTAQLQQAERIQNRRKEIWNTYYVGLKQWAEENNIALPVVSENCQQAYHMFFLLMPSKSLRTAFIEYLKQHNINAVFHYLPLNDSKMGKTFLNQPDNCQVSQNIAQRIVRLPFFYALSQDEQYFIIEQVKKFS